MTDVGAAETVRLDTHSAQLRELVQTTRDHLDAGRFESAAVFAQIAGTFAWWNHAGVFAAPEIEEVLGELSARLTSVAAVRPRTERASDVLHVVTQVYATGGPTQAITSWIEQDSARRHRVCLTRQGSDPVPAKILECLDGPSSLIRLDTSPGGLLARAGALRAAAAEADIVMLHPHPYDVIPIIAFAGASGMPPVVYVNHADHVFWLGTSVAGTVMHMRDSGRILSETRRGIDPARSWVMSRPLRLMDRRMSRAEAKRQLGVPQDRILVVTAADGAKYRPVGSPSFLELVVPVIEEHADAMLLAAGPSPDADWSAASERTGGRLRALGRLPDVSTLHQAADVYVDSFPFASLTSLLEAGSFGTPAITFRGHPAECLVLGADTRGVDEYLQSPSEPAEFRATLGRLITDASWRTELGEATRQAIRQTHTGDGWRSSVEGLYAFASRSGVPSSVGPAPQSTGPLDQMVDLIMARTGYGDGPSGAVRDNLGLLPLRERLAAWPQLVRDGTPPSTRHLLPEWALPPLARWRRKVRGAVRR